jgi:hypothetical protein
MQISTIVTTSPIPSNPSTEMIDKVLGRLFSISNNSVIIVFDGATVIDCQEQEAVKSSRIHQKSMDKYSEFKAAVEAGLGRLLGVENTVQQVGKRTWSEVECKTFERATVISHSIRIGFALAVYSGLQRVRTKFVIVNQHDWLLSKDTPLDAIISTMDRHDELNYVGFTSRMSKEYHKKARRVVEFSKESDVIVEFDGMPFCRLFFFYDRTHIARVCWYRTCVFSQQRFHRGDFIEDTFGHVIKDDCKEKGLSGWQEYKIWLYYPDHGENTFVQHLNGRFYIKDGSDMRKDFKNNQ